MLQPVVFFYRLQSTYNFYVILKQQNFYDKKTIYIEKMLNSYYIGFFYLKNNNI